MKKFFAVLAVFVLVLAGCPTDDGKGDGNGNGTTTKTTLTINNQSGYDMPSVQYSVDFGSINNGRDVTKDVPAGNRYILFSLRGINGNVQCRTDEILTCEEGKQNAFTFTINTIVSLANGERKNSLKNLYDALNRAEQTTLTIKNTSFTDITDVTWNNVPFASNQSENAIKAGATVTNDVRPGSGHIFFTRKSSPITARTSELITIAENDEKEFTFSDDTVIFEINDLVTNLNNSGTLRTLQTAVVWFDDAEGDMQPYYQNRSFVGYYNDGSQELRQRNFSTDLIVWRNYYNAPKNGNKSLAIGGTTDAMLTLRINLERSAKLSFWYANKGGNSYSTSIKINSSYATRNFSSDTNWSFIEFDLEPGITNITWEKTDGYSYQSYTYSADEYRYYYLTLDDILIYYTE